MKYNLYHRKVEKSFVKGGLYKSVIDSSEAQSSFAPDDVVDLLETLLLEMLVEGRIGDEGVHSVGHSVYVSVVGLDCVAQDLGAATLLGDNARHATLHSF